MNETKANRIRVLVADDHPVVREGLHAVITTLPDMEFVGAASSGAEVIELAETTHPDVVVMDLTLPDGDGVTATRRIVTTFPTVAVLVLTMHDEDEMLFAAVRAGAHGYLLKGATHDGIAAAIRAVARGDVLFGREVAQRILDDVARSSSPPLPQLSDREREVLQLLSAGRGTHEIASRLFLSPKTVRNHISSLMAKLGAHDRTHAVALARDAGITNHP